MKSMRTVKLGKNHKTVILHSFAHTKQTLRLNENVYN